jgi:hypothetical protein
MYYCILGREERIFQNEPWGPLFQNVQWGPLLQNQPKKNLILQTFKTV